MINYDFPTGVEDYVHRIGRTGRAGATGVSYTFFSEQDWKYAADLIKVLEGANQQVPPEVREIAVRGAPNFGKDRGAMSHFDSGSGVGYGRYDSVGRGGMRDGGYGGRGGMRDGNLGGRGGMRGGFGGRGGMRDGGFGGHGGRGDFFPGRSNRGRGFGSPGGGHVGRGRNDRSPYDRYNNVDGRGRGRGRGRFDNRRDIADRSRGRSYSRSPERVRTWGYSRSRSRSNSRSRSRSRSRSSSRGRSYSRSRSRGRNRSYSRSPSRSRSRGRGHSPNYDRYEKPHERDSDEPRLTMPEFEAATESGMSPMSPGTQGNASPGSNLIRQPQVVESTEALHAEAGEDLCNQTATAP